MAAKPSFVARWGVASDFTTDASNIATPSSGQQDTGFPLSAVPSSSFETWRANNWSKWIKYLSDGALSGAFTFDSTVVVTGQTTTNGNLQANGGITVPTGQAVAINGTSTLSVNGAINANGGVTAVSGTLNLTAVSATAVTGLLQANGGATVPTGQNLTLAGTADLKHGDRTLNYTAAGQLIAQAGTITTNLNADVVSSSACTIVGSIPLRVGDRIKSVAVTFDGIASQNVTNFQVSLIAANGTKTSLGSTTASTITTPTTKTVTCTQTTLAANQSFMLEIAISATGLSVRNLGITYDHP